MISIDLNEMPELEIGTQCLICGEFVKLNEYELREHMVKVCDECKKAVMKMRGKKGVGMTEKQLSDFEIVDKNAEINPCYGLEKFYITKEEIAALLSGKKLYSTVNCGEYTITIEMAESE